MSESKPKRVRSKTQVKFRLPAETHHTLSLIAEIRGESLTETINRALCQYLDENKAKAA